jgi:hypothetical protein
VTTFAIFAMATGPGTGSTNAGKERKTVPLKPWVLIHAKTEGVTEGAKIKKIEILKDAAVAKKSLFQVRTKDGKEVNRLNGTYVVKDAEITLVDDSVLKRQVLVAIEPGKTILRNVTFVSTLRAISDDKAAGTWYAYTAVFDTPAPEDGGKQF